jgi:hypothetical protein
VWSPTRGQPFLRASVTRPLRDGDKTAVPFRGARRAALVSEALAPRSDELTSEEIERLEKALAMLVGVESMVVLRGVLHLDHDEAREMGEWAVRQMVRAARRRPGGTQA